MPTFREAVVLTFPKERKRGEKERKKKERRKRRKRSVDLPVMFTE